MPRNACTECRSRKIKCITPRIGDRCERCTIRDLPCSNTSSQPSPRHHHPINVHSQSSPLNAPTGPFSASTPHPHHSSSTVVHGRSQQQQQKPPFGNPPLHRIVASRHHEENSLGFDIGSGSPADVLRESELTQEMLLLYFSNFSDIHFMFDRETFLRQFIMGDCPKLLLYPMMALGIRYSNSPIFEQGDYAQRGEPLFLEARKLLKLDYDLASFTVVQAYVLMATYHLTYGGARKAWLHLGTAASMAKILRLSEDTGETDPLKREMSHRLMCTIAVMDRTLSPSLSLPCYMSLSDIVPRPCDEEEFRRIKMRAPPVVSETPPANLAAEIFTLSHLFCQVCLYHRNGGDLETWQDLERQQSEWRNILHTSLIYNTTNFSLHQTKGTLREFIYLHLLYHHIGQLIYFPFLQAGSGNPDELERLRIFNCHQHATSITGIISYTWSAANFDVHNVSIGQILTVAAAVHMHACLTANSKELRESSQGNLGIITDCLSRIRIHCRIFNRVSAQLDTFFRICSQSSSSRNVFNRNERLIRHILHYGTAFERLNHSHAGLIEGLEGTEEGPSGPNSPPPPPPPPLGPSIDGNGNGNYLVFSTGQSLDFLGGEGLGNIHGDEAFQNCAWMFSDSSLNDLYTLSFMDPAVSMGGELYAL